MKNKLKTHKGTAKRIWRTGSGKLSRRQAGVGHHRGRKNVNQLLRRGTEHIVDKANPRLGELIPY